MKSTGCGARRLHIKVAAVLGIALILNALYAEQVLLYTQNSFRRFKFRSKSWRSD
jgi:hypothetical protein